MSNRSPVLDYIAVHVNHKRKGIASVLVKSGIDSARRMGIDMFIMSTTPAGGELYKKLGFTELDQIIQDFSAWGVSELYETRYFEMKTSQGYASPRQQFTVTEPRVI